MRTLVNVPLGLFAWCAHVAACAEMRAVAADGGAHGAFGGSSLAFVLLPLALRAALVVRVLADLNQVSTAKF